MTRATGSPLVRAGLTLVAGVLTGNLIGFARVALTAYFLGTHSRADSLAVAMGPLDTLNSVVINSVLFAFVPMLTALAGQERAALFRKLTRGFFWVSASVAAVVMLAAPYLMAVLAPGLDPAHFGDAVNILRILSLSTVAAGAGAVQCALLYTDRRFAPTAFYQAALNFFTIACALLLWPFLGVLAFAVGYTVGAWAQWAIVTVAARRGLPAAPASLCRLSWGNLLAKPAFFAVYAAGLGLNITFTRAYATQAGPGMAAALDYCMRGVGVPLAILVIPIANSLLPEIARLRSEGQLRTAFRLIGRTTALAAAAAAGICGFALLFRQPAIAILFQHGSFTAESTRMVSAVFLGVGPALLGWTLIEVASRALFSLNRVWPPIAAVAVPVLVNVIVTMSIHSSRPELLGVGASTGLLAGFAVLYLITRTRRSRWA
jgi:putative peptidoglycan lipid II flippase